MDIKIKESKELIKEKQKQLTKTTSKKEINKINNEIKRIENSMRKRALELERQAYINRYIARKERVIEANKRRIKATGQLFFIDNKEAMSSLKADDVLKLTNKLNKELEPYKKRIEDAKLCIKRIKEQNFSDIKGYYEHLQLTEDIKNGDALFPDKLRRKYFGRTFKGVTTYSDSQLISTNSIPTTKLVQENKKVAKELTASESKPKTKTDNETKPKINQKNIIEVKENKEETIKIDNKDNIVNKENKEKIKNISLETPQLKEKFPKDIYILRDYSGIKIKGIDSSKNISNEILIESITLNWENETDHFDWYKYKPEYKTRVMALLKKVDSLKRDGDPQILDAIILESFQNTSTDKEIEYALEKAEYLIEKYNQILINPMSNSKIVYNITKSMDKGIYYSSSKRFKTYCDNCLNQAEKAKNYAKLNYLDGNSGIKRFFRKVKKLIIGKEPAEELHVKKVETSRNLLRGLRSELYDYGNSNDEKSYRGQRNKVKIEEIEL